MDAHAFGHGITEPVPTLLERVLKHAVVSHAREHGGDEVEPVLRVGIPGQSPREFRPQPGDQLDLAMRTEILEAMARDDIDRDVVPLAWLTRMAGQPGFLDREDFAWAAAATCASGELGMRLDFVVITERAWRDPRSGVGRAWKRIRPHKMTTSAAADPTDN